MERFRQKKFILWHREASLFLRVYRPAEVEPRSNTPEPAN